MISIETTRVLTLIHKAVAGQLKQADLHQFIMICRAFSKACILRDIQQGRLDLNHSLVGGSKLDDFALDSIADLFARNDQGELIHLKQFFEPQLSELQQLPERTVPILRKLIASRVHQALVAHFSHVDQGGWRIWRNLSLAPKRQPEIVTFSFLDQQFFYYRSLGDVVNIPDDLNPQASAMPPAILQGYFQEKMKADYGLPKALAAVLQLMREQTDYQQFLAKGYIFKVLKEILNISYLDVEEIDLLIAPGNELQETDRSWQKGKHLEIIIPFIKKEISTRYLQKGKIDKVQERIYQRILELYFSDLLNDGYVETLPNYLGIAQAEHLAEGNWLIHRGRLEYLIKLGRNHLRELLQPADIPKNHKMQVYSKA